MYKQTLYKIYNDHLLNKSIIKQNKNKKFIYGYNEELDCVVISKNGTIGDIYEIQGLKVAIPKNPDKIYGSKIKKENQVFTQRERPKSLNRIKSIYDFKLSSENVKEEYYKYINEEFDRRNDGYWFMCNGAKTYLTGSHYMYLNWTKN